MSKQWAKEEANTNEVADLLERALLWVRSNPQPALWGAIGAVAVIAGTAAFFVRSAKVKEDSWARLSAATLYAQSGYADASLDQIKALTETHPGTPAAGYARLLAGDILFQQGKFKEAQQAFEAALAQSNPPALAPMSLSSLALAQEGAGEFAAAAGTAQRFLDSHQDHFLAPLTHAVLARSLAAQGKEKESKETFQRIEILYPGTYWEGWAKAHKG